MIKGLASRLTLYWYIFSMELGILIKKTDRVESTETVDIQMSINRSESFQSCFIQVVAQFFFRANSYNMYAVTKLL